MPEFSIANQRLHLDASTVERRMRDITAEPIDKHAVEIGGRLFPVVQALEVATGIPRSATRSANARALFRKLGFRLVEQGAGRSRTGPLAGDRPATTGDSPAPPVDQLVLDAMNRLRAPRVPLIDIVNGSGGLQLDSFGLYAIYGNELTWAELGLEPFDERPLYVGKAESGTLLTRDVATHFRSGRTGSSTVRRSFAALLHDSLDLRGQPRNLDRPARPTNYGLSELDDEKLTTWMIGRLELAAWPSPPDISLADVERSVLREWLPAINIRDSPGPWRDLVSKKRSVLADEARDWST